MQALQLFNGAPIYVPRLVSKTTGTWYSPAMWSKRMISEAAKRPLFEEPTPACEREDPWSGPKGFMFGGMCPPPQQYKETAQQYFQAADLLLAAIEEQKVEDFNVVNPVFFLYRHWLELMTKAVVGGVHEHNLETLFSKFESHFQAQDIVLPKWVGERFNELAAVDPDSTTFRYAERDIPGETYVSLPHLRRAMALLNVALLSLAERGELPTGSELATMLHIAFHFEQETADF